MKLSACLFIALLVSALPAGAQSLASRLADARVSHAADEPDRFTFQAGGKTHLLVIEPHARIERELAPYADAVRNGSDRYFRGGIDGRPGTWARLARIDNAWIGAVWDGDTLWLLDPASEHANAARAAGIAS